MTTRIPNVEKWYKLGRLRVLCHQHVIFFASGSSMLKIGGMMLAVSQESKHRPSFQL